MLAHDPEALAAAIELADAWVREQAGDRMKKPIEEER